MKAPFAQSGGSFVHHPSGSIRQAAGVFLAKPPQREGFLTCLLLFSHCCFLLHTSRAFFLVVCFADCRKEPEIPHISQDAQTPKMSTTTSAKDDAIAFASQKCFHQSITIGPTSAHQKLRVSFGTTSGFDDDGKNGLETILFCGGMGASRLLLYRIDALAKKEGVRVIFIDR